MSLRKKNLMILLVVTGIGVAFYVLNVLTPLCADDYSYLYTFIYTDEKFRITNLSELFYSQLNHYMVMNGRTVAHTLAQLFLMWGKPVFNVINTFVFLLLGWAMQVLMTGKWHFQLSYFLFGMAVIWFFTPSFGQDYLWLTGSCTYLYCILIILLFLIPFRRACTEENHGGIWRAVLFLPFGVAAGWSSENAAAAMIVMEICFLIVLRLSRKTFRAWMFTGLAGSLIGFALLILSPGQSVRLENSGGTGTWRVWISRGISITLKAVKYLWFPALIFLVLVIWYLIHNRTRPVRELWISWLPTIVFLIGSVVSAYSMIVSPQFPQRTWNCILIFTVITAGSVMPLCPPLKIRRAVSGPVCCLILAATVITYSQGFLSIRQTHRDVAARADYIEELLAEGITEATVEPIYADNKYNCFDADGDLILDSTEWPNTAIARYYGLDAIHSTEEGSVDGSNG